MLCTDAPILYRRSRGLERQRRTAVNLRLILVDAFLPRFPIQLEVPLSESTTGHMIVLQVDIIAKHRNYIDY